VKGTLIYVKGFFVVSFPSFLDFILHVGKNWFLGFRSLEFEFWDLDFGFGFFSFFIFWTALAQCAWRVAEFAGKGVGEIGNTFIAYCGGYLRDVFVAVAEVSNSFFHALFENEVHDGRVVYFFEVSRQAASIYVNLASQQT
jgi:hypothetical protein